MNQKITASSKKEFEEKIGLERKLPARCECTEELMSVDDMIKYLEVHTGIPGIDKLNY